MTINLEEYEQLRKKAEQLQRRADRTQGEMNQVLRSLKDEFGVASLKDGEKLAKKLKQEEGDLARKAEEAKDAWDEKWGSKLEEG